MKQLLLSDYDVQSLTTLEETEVNGGDKAARNIGNAIGAIGGYIHNAWDSLVESIEGAYQAVYQAGYEAGSNSQQ